MDQRLSRKCSSGQRKRALKDFRLRTRSGSGQRNRAIVEFQGQEVQFLILLGCCHIVRCTGSIRDTCEGGRDHTHRRAGGIEKG